MRLLKNKKLFLISFCFVLFLNFQIVDAANVSGFAAIFNTYTVWNGENAILSPQLTGWVVFNKTGPNSCDTDGNNAIDVSCGGDNTVENYPIPSDYGVSIGANGTFSGYAWYYLSDAIKGWLDFDHSSDAVGCNAFGGTPSIGCKAYADINTWEVSGWSKAVGGISGWIDFKDTEIINGIDFNFNVSLFDSLPPVKDFRGKAVWLIDSGASAYFLSFNCIDGHSGQNVCATTGNYKAQYNVSVDNQKPTVTVGAPQFFYCTKSGFPASPDEGKIALSWTYSDADGDAQAQSRIQVSGDPKFGSATECVYEGTGNTTQFITKISPNSGCSPIQLNYSQTYYWRVSVKAGSGETDWSSWANGNSFTTPSKPYPYAYFIPPTNVKKEQNVTFTDGSKCYDNSLNQKSCSDVSFGASVSYLWNFSDGTPLESTKGDIKHKYPNTIIEGPYPAVLTVTQGGNSCNFTSIISVGKSFDKPVWIEISPF